MSDLDLCPNCVTPWKCNGPHVPTIRLGRLDDADSWEDRMATAARARARARLDAEAALHEDLLRRCTASPELRGLLERLAPVLACKAYEGASFAVEDEELSDEEVARRTLDEREAARLLLDWLRRGDALS